MERCFLIEMEREGIELQDRRGTSSKGPCAHLMEHERSVYGCKKKI